MTEIMAAAAVVTVAEGAEVVVDLEEEEVADGDESIELQNETTRRGCITAWSVFLAQYPHEAWQRGAGMVTLHLNISLSQKDRDTETSSNHGTREFE